MSLNAMSVDPRTEEVWNGYAEACSPNRKAFQRATIFLVRNGFNVETAPGEWDEKDQLPVKSVQIQAVELGYAEWVVSPDGSTEFKWKESK